jgi:UDP-N-acetylmuramate--alanine ligase
MKRVHFIGIGGTGLSAIAQVLLESGVQVSGSDRQLSPLAERVRAAGARVFVGHQAENVYGADLVVRSSAVGDDNVEVQAARAAGIPVLKRSDLLSDLLQGKQGIAVAGSHGKTTTTAMIAWIFSALGQDPSYIIGSVSANLGTNAHAGSGPHFVIEADEYDYMFLGLRPQVAVVTNVEHDHPDCFPTPADFHAAFAAFTRRIQPGGWLLVCGDDPGAAGLLQTPPAGVHALTYGLSGPGYALHARHLLPQPGAGFAFTAYFDQAQFGAAAVPASQPVHLLVPGQHNVLNALAALGAAVLCDLPVAGAAQALGEFQGAGRRFEVRGEVAGITVIDDYAHHPTEIRATLAAARARYPGRPLWVVWQPHTYSRTRTLYPDFLGAFSQADRLLVTDIYAAREAPPADGFSAQKVVNDLAQAGVPQVQHVPSLEAAASYLLSALEPGAVLLVLSAGDADRISAAVFTGLAQRSRSGS